MKTRHRTRRKTAKKKVFRKKTPKSLAVSKKLLCTRNSEMVPVVQLVRASDCGSECRRFESVRAPSRDIAERQCLFCPTKETSLLRCLFLFCRFQIPTYRPAKFFTWSQSGICALVLYFYIGLSLVYIYLYLSLARCRLFRSQIGKTFSKH